jgi:RNA polymerase sigma-70 factor, ECF subfamily
MTVPDPIDPVHEPCLAGLPRRPDHGEGHAVFESLVAPYVQRLYRFLIVRLGDERDARDALQETLLAAWQGLPQLRERDRPWSWLAGIAAHKAADTGRRRQRSVPLDEAGAAYELSGSSDAWAALAKLPRAAREVLLLRYLLRLTEDETAVALGVRVGTVKSRAARARRLLLEELG